MATSSEVKIVYSNDENTNSHAIRLGSKITLLSSDPEALEKFLKSDKEVMDKDGIAMRRRDSMLDSLGVLLSRLNGSTKELVFRRVEDLLKMTIAMVKKQVSRAQLNQVGCPTSRRPICLGKEAIEQISQMRVPADHKMIFKKVNSELSFLIEMGLQAKMDERGILELSSPPGSDDGPDPKTSKQTHIIQDSSKMQIIAAPRCAGKTFFYESIRKEVVTPILGVRGNVIAKVTSDDWLLFDGDHLITWPDKKEGRPFWKYMTEEELKVEHKRQITELLTKMSLMPDLKKRVLLNVTKSMFECLRGVCVVSVIPPPDVFLQRLLLREEVEKSATIKTASKLLSEYEHAYRVGRVTINFTSFEAVIGELDFGYNDNRTKLRIPHGGAMSGVFGYFYGRSPMEAAKTTDVTVAIPPPEWIFESMARLWSEPDSFNQIIWNEADVQQVAFLITGVIMLYSGAGFDKRGRSTSLSKVLESWCKKKVLSDVTPDWKELTSLALLSPSGDGWEKVRVKDGIPLDDKTYSNYAIDAIDQYAKDHPEGSSTISQDLKMRCRVDLWDDTILGPYAPMCAPRLLSICMDACSPFFVFPGRLDYQRRFTLAWAMNIWGSWWNVEAPDVDLLSCLSSICPRGNVMPTKTSDEFGKVKYQYERSSSRDPMSLAQAKIELSCSTVEQAWSIAREKFLDKVSLPDYAMKWYVRIFDRVEELSMGFIDARSGREITSALGVMKANPCLGFFAAERHNLPASTTFDGPRMASNVNLDAGPIMTAYFKQLYLQPLTFRPLSEVIDDLKRLQAPTGSGSGVAVHVVDPSKPAKPAVKNDDPKRSKKAIPQGELRYTKKDATIIFYLHKFLNGEADKMCHFVREHLHSLEYPGSLGFRNQRGWRLKVRGVYPMPFSYLMLEVVTAKSEKGVAENLRFTAQDSASKTSQYIINHMFDLVSRCGVYQDGVKVNGDVDITRPYKIIYTLALDMSNFDMHSKGALRATSSLFREYLTQDMPPHFRMAFEGQADYLERTYLNGAYVRTRESDSDLKILHVFGILSGMFSTSWMDSKANRCILQALTDVLNPNRTSGVGYDALKDYVKTIGLSNALDKIPGVLASECLEEPDVMGDDSLMLNSVDIAAGFDPDSICSAIIMKSKVVVGLMGYTPSLVATSTKSANYLMNYVASGGAGKRFSGPLWSREKQGNPKSMYNDSLINLVLPETRGVDPLAIQAVYSLSLRRETLSYRGKGMKSSFLAPFHPHAIGSGLPYTIGPVPQNVRFHYRFPEMLALAPTINTAKRGLKERFSDEIQRGGFSFRDETGVVKKYSGDEFVDMSTSIANRINGVKLVSDVDSAVAQILYSKVRGLKEITPSERMRRGVTEAMAAYVLTTPSGDRMLRGVIKGMEGVKMPEFLPGDILFETSQATFVLSYSKGLPLRVHNEKVTIGGSSPVSMSQQLTTGSQALVDIARIFGLTEVAPFLKNQSVGGITTSAIVGVMRDAGEAFAPVVGSLLGLTNQEIEKVKHLMHETDLMKVFDKGIPASAVTGDFPVDVERLIKASACMLSSTDSETVNRLIGLYIGASAVSDFYTRWLRHYALTGSESYVSHCEAKSIPVCLVPVFCTKSVYTSLELFTFTDDFQALGKRLDVVTGRV